MRSDLAQNELSVAYNADGATRAVSFEATPGGNVRITLKYTGAVLTVNDGVAPVGEADEKGRYRPLKTGYIVWAIINLPVYLLGLVPLVKTVRAAKQPDEILAQNQLRSAKGWNIGLSCVLGVAAIAAILMNLMR